MENLGFLIFISVFVLMIMVGALAVTGWYFITRGSLEVMPDGTIRRNGKIFKGWYFFWTKKKKEKKRYYFKGDQLNALHFEYLQHFPDNPLNIIVSLSKYSGELSLVPCRWIKEGKFDFSKLDEVERVLDIEFERINIKELLPYTEEDIYVFPELIRTPLAECATCFSSIYGSIFYWGIVLQFNGLFDWATYIVASKIFFWITFCLTLSVVNTALAKKYN